MRQIPPHSPQEEPILWRPWCWTSSLQNSEALHLLFKLPSLLSWVTVAPAHRSSVFWGHWRLRDWYSRNTVDYRAVAHLAPSPRSMLVSWHWPRGSTYTTETCKCTNQALSYSFVGCLDRLQAGAEKMLIRHIRFSVSCLWSRRHE